MGRVTKAIAGILAVVLVVVGGYAAYLIATYDRIEDGVSLEVRNNADQVLKAGKSYSALTFNVGFGAYTPDFTFFLDDGVMKDGTKKVGTQSVAASKESVVALTQRDAQVLQEADVDFALMQEVDTDATRSHHVNQVQMIEDALPGMGGVEACIFHSAFLFYPVTQPHGASDSCLLTLSKAHVDQAVRRSYPVAQDLTKFLDLDRCFSQCVIPVDNGKNLVLINSHMSAYDQGGVIRPQQMELLAQAMAEAAAKGDYVVVGGDFNHALCNSLALYPSQQQIPSWIVDFDEASLPDGFRVVEPRNLRQVATVRGTDIPYEEGVTYRSTVDGFIVSDNVEAAAETLDEGFATSDHNPVKLTFSLR